MPLALVTGFPGFIGRRLVARLLEDDSDLRVAALVEERRLEPARNVAAALDTERIELLPGDIAHRRLGLSDQDHDRLCANVTHVFHLAAIYDLSVPVTVAQRVNVDGTGNVLELCLQTQRLKRLVYASTAYVAGRRAGVAYEHELVMGQGFKNHYESTKFQAEVWVRQLLDRVPTTILRPAIVVGDSHTGETEKFDGPYYLLRVISRAARAGRAMVQFGASEVPFNVVPVDYVVGAFATAARDEAMVGHTLHLVDPEPLPTRDLVALLSQEYAGQAPRGRIPPRLAAASLRVPALREALGGAPPESIAYLNHPVTFDARQATDLLGRPPRFEEYVGPIVNFFREHEHDPAYRPNQA